MAGDTLQNPDATAEAAQDLLYLVPFGMKI